MSTCRSTEAQRWAPRMSFGKRAEGQAIIFERTGRSGLSIPRQAPRNNLAHPRHRLLWKMALASGQKEMCLKTVEAEGRIRGEEFLPNRRHSAFTR